MIVERKIGKNRFKYRIFLLTIENHTWHWYRVISVDWRGERNLEKIKFLGTAKRNRLRTNRYQARLNIYKNKKLTVRHVLKVDIGVSQ